MTNQTAPHRTASARRSQRRPRAQHLITADEHTLLELETLLATLPLCATGRVFVEVPDAAHRAPITVPSRMTLTWLERSTRSGAPGTGRGCTTGVALTRAVTAWADEMMCDEAGATDAQRTRVHLLGGGFLGTADIIDHLTDRLDVPVHTIDAPERFGLLSPR